MKNPALFPVAVEKFRRWVTEYWVYYNRIAGFGDTRIAYARKHYNTSVNEALAQRFRIDVLEDDKDRLNLPDLDKTTVEDIRTLNNRFRQWAESVGEDAGTPSSPRFSYFLVIDAVSLQELAALSEQIPLLRQVAVDRDEFLRRRAEYNCGQLWLVDSRAVVSHHEDSDQRYRGWMKIGVSSLPEAWFYAAWMLGEGGGDEKIECMANPEGSGSFWYVGK